MAVGRPVIAHGMSSYGEIGDEAGPNALGLLDNLLAEKGPMDREIAGRAPRWDEGDAEGFMYLLRLDSDMACLDPSFDMEGPATGELIRPWQQLTTSLPFSEAERYWLLGATRAARKSRIEFQDLPAALMHAESPVISAGLRRAVRGRHLVRRWASWRREMHEYEGQGSLPRAIFLLDHMAYELAPRMFTQPEFAEQYPYVAAFDARAIPQTELSAS